MCTKYVVGWSKLGKVQEFSLTVQKFVYAYQKVNCEKNLFKILMFDGWTGRFYDKRIHFCKNYDISKHHLSYSDETYCTSKFSERTRLYRREFRF